MISREEIDNLAELARLKLGEEEAVALQKDISNILEYVGQVSAVSAGTQGDALKPGLSKASPLALHNVMREDAPRDADDPMAGKREQIIAAFPRHEKEYLVVRKIIQKDE
ncbi:MAG: Asp-tRNA(Asn)/Glu-tRNA(Gln) amidotransferase subunit GatC [bacterium]|nr:Asp-tRNA(Asn)/Glu-tRNA(Gln) amidotransferase subunit GatC [bacterium]